MAEASKAYRVAEFATADQGKLIVMLYEKMEEELSSVLEILKKENRTPSDIMKVHNSLVKTEEIISELMASLNLDYEIGKNLWAVYDYWLWKLVDANLEKKPEPVEEVLGYVKELKEAWEKALENVGGSFKGKGNQTSSEVRINVQI